jgi:hypothetical protein
MTESSNLGKRLATKLKENFDILLYFGPPFYFGWRGTGIIAPILWWGVLAVFALSSEYRPDPNYDELKSRPIAFCIGLVAFVAIYFVARWLSPN